MTAAQQKLIGYVVNGIISIVASLFVLTSTGLLTGLLASKENVADHRHDVGVVAETVKGVNAKLDRIIDMICDRQTVKPRACTPDPSSVP